MKNYLKMMVVFIFIFVFLTPVYVFADDNRIEINTVELTSNMGLPTYGGEVKRAYEYNTVVGEPAYMTPHMGSWYKRNGNNWKRYDEAIFREGTYYFSNQIRIDDASGLTHKLGKSTTLKVDDALWTLSNQVDVYDTYSMAYYNSPEYVVEKNNNLELTFVNSSTYNIGANYVGRAINEYSVAGGVLGGTGSYTFSKVSGPEWVIVSSNGSISGTPTQVGRNNNLVIRVTDEADAYKEITVTVVDTAANPANRITVSNVELTSNMVLPTYGGEVKHVYEYNTVVGEPAYMTPHMGSWYKKNGEHWQKYQEAVFTAGTYYFSNQIRIDGASGATHKLGEDTTLKVDGISWTLSNQADVYDTYSMAYYNSPEYIVEEPAKNPVNIVFNAEGGTLKKNSKVIYTNSTYGELEAPIRRGYTFVGWYTAKNGGIKIESSTETGDNPVRNLYARWAVTKYKINYSLYGGTNNKDNPSEYTINTKVVLKNPILKGYVFEGWYSDVKTKKIIKTIEKGNIGNKTLYAKWKKITYKIGYNLYGGVNNKVNPKTYNVTSKINLKNPTLRGYTFIGWYDVNDKKIIASIEPGTVGNKTLNAKWKKTPYKINYNLYGGINNKSNPSTYTITSKVDLKNPILKGYKFLGWYDVKTKKKVTVIKKGSIGNRNLYAKWKKITYKINYNLYGGKNNKDNPKTYTVTSKINLKNPTLKGYAFVGWYDTKTKKIIKSIEKETVGNRVLNAKWKKVTYKINYNLYGGLNNKSNPSTYTMTSNVNLKNPTLKGYKFIGWYDVNTKKKVTVIKKGSIGNKTLNAKWQKITYSINYNLYGGVNNKANPKAYNVTSKISLKNPTLSGYIFAGWYDVNSKKMITSIEPGTIGNKTLNAKWVKETAKTRALKKAKDYLLVMAFSYQGLVDQLKYDGFSESDAKYGVDNCGANWREQALRKAKSYLSSMSFSYDGLLEQLKYEGFSESEAKYGVDNCEANWREQALRKAKSYLSSIAFSYDGLLKQLKYEKFSESEAKYGVDNCEANWREQAVRKARSYISNMSFSYDQLVSQLEYEGFSHEDAVYAANEVLN